MKIGIINYGIGNYGNIRRALNNCNINFMIINKPSDFKLVDKIILPGVGAFSVAIKDLKEKNLFNEIINFASNGKYILGICLGMQVLFSKSNEFGQTQGLDILSGKITKIKSNVLPIPHIGWAKILPSKNSNNIFSDIKEDQYFYFAHSMQCKTNENYNFSYYNYGDTNILATIAKKNVFGTQFHPELSGENGLKIFRNFARL